MKLVLSTRLRLQPSFQLLLATALSLNAVACQSAAIPIPRDPTRNGRHYRILVERGPIATDRRGGSSPHDARGGGPQVERPVPHPVLPKDAPTVTVGLGGIIDEFDGTTETFSAYRYFTEHPIPSKTAHVQVKLVDHPIEADYVIGGNLSGEINYTYVDKTSEMTSGTILVTTGASLSVMMGVTSLLISGVVDMQPSGRSVLQGIGITSLLVGLPLTVWGVVKSTNASNFPANQFDWTHEATLDVHRHGRRVEQLKIETAGHLESNHQEQAVRARSTRELWRQVGQHLAKRIDADVAQGVEAER